MEIGLMRVEIELTVLAAMAAMAALAAPVLVLPSVGYFFDTSSAVQSEIHLHYDLYSSL
jgi:hypothetical protein